ncbi:hypothetical protein K7711_44345 [Nocardia sp. CA2R105]|uniref:hypothetical protein n=1 Tax=Nocardia coffeae TaxID=2873381 RepID=UPI001CA6AF87|nr:hypothetical protein [Nocardia coffeae]MBY8863564.1 hypothetical protein [Nocardia coffeae]
MTDIAPLAASTRAAFGDPGVHVVVRAGRVALDGELVGIHAHLDRRWQQSR